MSKHRTRARPRSQPPPPPPEPPTRAELLADQVAELYTLWRVMPYALARDENGQIKRDQAGDRQQKGAAKGSSSTINFDVSAASAIVETGLIRFAAQAAPLLGEDLPRTVLDVLAQLPAWHTALTGVAHGRPLARELEADLPSWLRQVREAIRVQRPDRALGQMCPDHPARPGKLLMVGATATLARTLLAGPPDQLRLLTGATCPLDDHVACHTSCVRIRESRIIDEHGQPTDWIIRHGEPHWAGGVAWVWTQSKSIRCQRCRRVWTSLAERRILAAQLKANGVKVDLLALITQ